MHFPTQLASLALLASAVLAAPHDLSPRATGAQNVVYWGQNGGGTIENNDLSTYCTPTSGIDVIVLGFLYEFGSNGNLIASGTIGQSCFITSAGVGQNCDALTAAIATCKSNGVKIIMSLGGASSSWSLSSQSEAQTIGQNLWEAYGNVAAGSVPRPFGTNFVDGWDFDIESNFGNQYFQYMIAQLRSNFASDSAHKYYITGAPQCPIPEPNMGEIVSASTFDYLFVQFYNNNNYTYPCALGFNGDAAFNYNQWVSFIAGTPSAKSKIFIGVPAAPLAANGGPGGSIYYITPPQLSSLVSQYKSNAAFGGIMMWSAGFSDSNVIDGCTYAQQAKSILVNGTPCGGSGPVSASTSPKPTTTSAKVTTKTSTATATSPASTAVGTVPEYDQCGGSGYTGPTVCIAPYKCIANSAYWSQCG